MQKILRRNFLFLLQRAVESAAQKDEMLSAKWWQRTSGGGI